jgi:hypothetical protein
MRLHEMVIQFVNIVAYPPYNQSLTFYPIVEFQRMALAFSPHPNTSLLLSYRHTALTSLGNK